MTSFYEMMLLECIIQLRVRHLLILPLERTYDSTTTSERALVRCQNCHFPIGNIKTCSTSHVERQISKEMREAYMTRKPTTLRSRISSSYLSDSSGLSGASSARTAFRRPDPLCDGSTTTGCISDMIRVPPIGSAEVGAMVSDTDSIAVSK